MSWWNLSKWYLYFSRWFSIYYKLRSWN